MAKQRASEWVKQQRENKAKAKASQKQEMITAPVKSGGDSYGTGGTAIAAISLTSLIYLSLVIGNGTGDELIKSLKTETGLFKFVGVMLILNSVLGLFGVIGRGLMTLIVFGAVIELAPNAVKNINKMIDKII